jgi:hypothetical protein
MEEELYNSIGLPHDRFLASFCPLCSNFEGKTKGTCPAYPEGIPDKFAIRLNKHLHISEGQTGNFIFQHKND